MLGANGFIGRRVTALLTNSGFHVVAGVRRPEAAIGLLASEIRTIDFRAQATPAQWDAALANVGAVVNLVGIFRERGDATYATVQRDVPMALFDACERSAAGRVVQLSALGADARATTPFLATKRQADDDLLRRTLDAIVLQPSLVYGDDGASSRLFRMLATTPLLMLPAGGRQLVQPIHVDDVAAAIVQALRQPLGARRHGRRIPLVGPSPLTLADYLAVLRDAMGFHSPLRVIPVPIRLAAVLARLAGHWPGSLVNEDAVTMLAGGSTADATAVATLLERPPRPPAHFIAAGSRELLKREAVLGWMLPLLRWSVGFLWIATAIVSACLYPVEASMALLARAGVPPALQQVALYGAAGLDLLFGVLCVLPRRPSWLWKAQALLIGTYTAIISVRLPEFWLHPYGPISKNVPLLGLIWLLDLLERRSWTTSR